MAQTDGHGNSMTNSAQRGRVGEKVESVNQWGNEKGACKTAIAKMDMLKLICFAIFMKF